ncbi:unnamed protein product [Eruca vesicaria subsp. sativa]|uniref:VQ domain-containing protein n=1 Tax=Eruca vesicaria subsp. sativa TaxID=29727 RepID=A0ABC8KZI1_ERUVS|nr:unnamed protein product [Eruca vesicaria subsp. sativa]
MNKQERHNVATCNPITTFVQTDTNTFREIVQRLTGSSENNNATAVPEATVIKTATQKRETSKLHERRQCMRPKLEMVKPPLSFNPTGMTPSSKLGINNLLTSPVATPSSLFSDLSLIEGDKAEPESCTTNIDQEEKAIRERFFNLHPSPRSKPGYTEPELLSLFPLTSPNSSGRQSIRQINPKLVIFLLPQSSCTCIVFTTLSLKEKDCSLILTQRSPVEPNRNITQ